MTRQSKRTAAAAAAVVLALASSSTSASSLHEQQQLKGQHRTVERGVQNDSGDSAVHKRRNRQLRRTAAAEDDASNSSGRKLATSHHTHHHSPLHEIEEEIRIEESLAQTRAGDVLVEEGGTVEYDVDVTADEVSMSDDPIIDGSTAAYGVVVGGKSGKSPSGKAVKMPASETKPAKPNGSGGESAEHTVTVEANSGGAGDAFDYADDTFSWEDTGVNDVGPSAVAVEEDSVQEDVVIGSSNGSPSDYDDDTFHWEDTDNESTDVNHQLVNESLKWESDGHTPVAPSVPSHPSSSKSSKQASISKAAKLFKSNGKSGKHQPIIPVTLHPTFKPSSSPMKGMTLSPVTSKPTLSLATLYPSSAPPTSAYPPLTWAGVDSCSFFYACPICTGDCDSDTDCLPTLKCFKRGDGESTQVPGCGTGGVGDIPGADYCYDPSNGDVSSVPSTSVSGEPTNEPTTFPIVEIGTPAPSSGGTYPPLEWKGVNGCTPSTQCNICSGDCDNDEDCIGDYLCFKRADGMKNQVPGCEIGGIGDISGADYCYDPSGGGLSPTGSPSVGGVMTDAPQVATLNPSVSPTFALPSKVSPLPTDMSQEGFFLRSQSRGIVTANKSNRNLQVGNPFATVDWCASGALSPDYYQLLLDVCTPDSNSTSRTPIERIEQMDQLWSMDSDGLIHSIFDYERCMTVQPGRSVLDEASVEIGPCDVNNPLSRFYYDDSSSMPFTLKLKGDEYSTLCVTFLGAIATKGAPLIMTQCGSRDKFGWDFISEDVYGKPSAAPTSSLPSLRYHGRNMCTADSPCGACSGDCDGDSGCQSGLMCFQRARDETSQVPGCAVGGTEDIPGADYCYDPTSESPPLVWLGEDGCSEDQPCNRCAGSCSNDGDCKGNLECFVRIDGESTSVPGCSSGGIGDVLGTSCSCTLYSIFFPVPSNADNVYTSSLHIIGGDYCYDPDAAFTPSPTKTPSSLPTLRWRGSEGCSPDSPCPSCTGDCDNDNDCDSTLKCFKRFAGDRTQVPGCATGGLGDIPGGDYCYDSGNEEHSTSPLASGKDQTEYPTMPIFAPSGGER